MNWKIGFDSFCGSCQKARDAFAFMLSKRNAQKMNDAFRIANNKKLKKWYFWDLHLAANVLLVLGAMAIVGDRLRAFTFGLSEVAALFLFFHVWAIVEYGIHRFILHAGVFSRLKFYAEHSIFHHGYFTQHNMTLEAPIDLNRILLYTSDLLVVIGLDFAVSILFGRFVNFRFALLFCLAGLFYIAAYELIHALCHVKRPAHSKLLQCLFSFFSRSIQHHRLHHDPKQMRTANFAVVFPYLDRLFASQRGTAAPGANHV
jgi:hypothetical protein